MKKLIWNRYHRWSTNLKNTNRERIWNVTSLKLRQMIQSKKDRLDSEKFQIFCFQPKFAIFRKNLKNGN